MAVVTYNNILQAFEDISNAHLQVHTHGCGSEWDIATSGTVNYPMCWVVPTDSSLTGKVYNSNFTLIFMDLVHKDVRDVDEVVSDMELIAQDYIAQLLKPDYDFDFKADNIPFRRFEDSFDDEVAGVAIDITIRTQFVFDRCAIPSTTINTEGGGVISGGVVTIVNQNGAFVAFVNAGSNYTVIQVSIINGGASDTTYTNSIIQA